MADFSIKEGDTKPILNMTLKDANDAAVNLDTATTITLKVQKIGATDLIVDVVVSDESATGKISYTFTAAQTATPGHYVAEVLVLWSTGVLERFPTEGQFTVDIEDALD